MKKLVLMLAVITSTFLCAAAREVNVSEKVKKSFTAEFAAAQDVVWTTTSNYYRASFLYNGSYVNAYYSIDEDLVAVTRNISPADLPVSLQAAVKKNYSTYWVSDLFEISNAEGTSYYITLENAETTTILKSIAGGAWTNYKKIHKS